jgi:hypothetical protein
MTYNLIFKNQIFQKWLKCQKSGKTDLRGPKSNLGASETDLGVS